MAKIALGTWAWGAGAFGGDTVFGSKTDVDNLKPVFDKISLAWLLTKVESPIVGATKLHHIEGALKSLDVRLSADDIRYLEEPYVPHNLSGVMAVNKPVMSEEPVWVKASRNK